MKISPASRAWRLIAFPLSGLVFGALLFALLMGLGKFQDPFRKFNFAATVTLVFCLVIPAVAGVVLATVGLINIDPIQRAFGRITYVARLFTWVGIVSGLFMFFRPGHEGLAILGFAAIALPCVGALIVGMIFPIAMGWICHVLGIVLGFGLVFVELVLDLFGEERTWVLKRLLFVGLFGVVLSVWFSVMSGLDNSGVPSNGFQSWNIPGYILVLCRPGFILSCGFTGWLSLVFSQRPVPSKISLIYNVHGCLIGTVLGTILSLFKLPINFDIYQILCSCSVGVIVVLFDQFRWPSKQVSDSTIFSNWKGRLLFNIPMVIFICLILGFGFHLSAEQESLMQAVRFVATHKRQVDEPDAVEIRLDNRSRETTLESVEYVTVRPNGPNRVYGMDGLQLGPQQSKLFLIHDRDLAWPRDFRVLPNSAKWRVATPDEIRAGEVTAKSQALKPVPKPYKKRPVGGK